MQPPPLFSERPQECSCCSSSLLITIECEVTQLRHPQAYLFSRGPCHRRKRIPSQCGALRRPSPWGLSHRCKTRREAHVLSRTTEQNPSPANKTVYKKQTYFFPGRMEQKAITSWFSLYPLPWSLDLIVSPDLHL